MTHPTLLRGNCWALAHRVLYVNSNQHLLMATVRYIKCTRPSLWCLVKSMRPLRGSQTSYEERRAGALYSNACPRNGSIPRGGSFSCQLHFLFHSRGVGGEGRGEARWNWELCLSVKGLLCLHCFISWSGCWYMSVRQRLEGAT